MFRGLTVSGRMFTVKRLFLDTFSLGLSCSLLFDPAGMLFPNFPENPAGSGGSQKGILRPLDPGPRDFTLPPHPGEKFVREGHSGIACNPERGPVRFEPDPEG